MFFFKVLYFESLHYNSKVIINLLDNSLARIIHEGKEARAFNVVESRYDTVLRHKKAPHEERYHTTECSI